ncbi:MAG: LacI family DNA-binding transcriptional regulator [Candidatus Omnitrophota bacterium]
MDIVDVAKLAGVSITTVSRVLNNVPTVKEYNKKNVLAAIKQLGYKPNIVARRLASKHRQNTVGLLIPPFEEMFGSFFVSEVLKGINEASSKLGYDLLLYIAQDKQGMELLRGDIMNPSFISGILFADLDGNAKLLDTLAAEGIPFVVMNNYFETIPISCIGIDNKKAVIEVVDYLVKLGHKRIATITGNLETQSARKRLEGFRVGLRKHGIAAKEDFIIQGDYTRESARRSMKKLLSQKPTPSAVFVASDEMAQGAIEAVFEKGLKIPGDISMVGFDDSYIASLGVVPLTTVHQPLAEMGRKAVEMLSQLMANEKKPPLKMFLKAKLIERISTRRYSGDAR